MLYFFYWTKSYNSHDFYQIEQIVLLELEIQNFWGSFIYQYLLPPRAPSCMKKTSKWEVPLMITENTFCPVLLCIISMQLYEIWGKNNYVTFIICFALRLSFGLAPQILSYLRPCNPKSFIKHWAPPFLREEV